MWNTVEAGDTNSLYSSNVSLINDFGDIEPLRDEGSTDIDIKEPPPAKKSFCKTFTQIDVHSAIDFIDTDGEFIVSAGQDHDINVWNVSDGKNVRRLRGHNDSVTGLKVLQLGHWVQKSPDRRVVISSSRDGTIRQWSLRRGEEVRQIVTPNVLTCMGVLNTTLVATGNHKGHLELYHLVTGKLFAHVAAHKEPIDTLVADDVYICTAVYDRPCSLKVWTHKWGKFICTYRLEELHRISFSSFALVPSGNTLLLGSADKMEVHIVSMGSEKKQRLELSETWGYVQHVRTLEELVLISAVNIDGMVQLYVYLQKGLDHLATFCCKEMERISSIAVLRYEGSLKFILGGSSLAILQLDDSESSDCLEELKNRHPSMQKTTLQENVALSGYLLVSEEEAENSIKHNAGPNCIKNRELDPSEPQDEVLLDKLKNLSIADNGQRSETKNPMVRGIVTLPPIYYPKDPPRYECNARHKPDGGEEADGKRFENTFKNTNCDRNESFQPKATSGNGAKLQKNQKKINTKGKKAQKCDPVASDKETSLPLSAEFNNFRKMNEDATNKVLLKNSKKNKKLKNTANPKKSKRCSIM